MVFYNDIKEGIMKLFRYSTILLCSAALTLSSCSESFLDHEPNERAHIDSEKDVLMLLCSAYPTANYQWVAELSSDNLIDNSAPHMPSSPGATQILSHYNYGSYSRFDDQLFKFEPASMATYNDYDSPGSLWNEYYYSIATVNHALQAIDEIAAKSGMTERLKAARAEALLVRAYCHFILVNLFSQGYKNEEKSKNDIGIPYVKEVEDVVQKSYSRGNVADVYAQIREDLEEGLRDQSDAVFEQPKWHFNKNAAHAFAARFYLYTRQWDKVIEHANQVLGTDSTTTANMMMNYSTFDGCSSVSDYGTAWQHPNLSNNLMLIKTGSLYYRRIFGYRYSMAGPTAREVMMYHTHRGLWSGYYVTPIAIVSGMLFSSSSSDYGFFNCKMYEEFEYSDKIAGIGYPHMIMRAFTGNDLLLERAEASIMLGRYADAARDLKYYWNNSINTFTEADKKAFYDAGYISYLTDEHILSWYANGNNENCFSDWNFTQNVSSDYIIPAQAVPYMNCLNDFRRFENSFEGLRFFDLKRWGMEYKHIVGPTSQEFILKADDERRAIEVPWEALSAGLESSRSSETGQAPDHQLQMNANSFRINNDEEE